ncbi:MAG: DoxX family protein [Flavobacteriaceae bacterium]|nr:DoxX family protein [Flavobacteriaceae bacterium]
MKTNKIIYWSTTGLLSGLLLMSAWMYIFKNEMISQVFTSFGYPTYLIYPLVVLKIAAVIVLLTQKQNFIKYLAYAGLFFEFILAFFAHIMVKDGEQITAVIAMLLLVSSYIYSSKVFNFKVK